MVKFHLGDVAQTPRQKRENNANSCGSITSSPYLNLISRDFQATISGRDRAPINRLPVCLNETAAVMGHKDHVNPDRNLTLRGCSGPISTTAVTWYKCHDRDVFVGVYHRPLS